MTADLGFVLVGKNGGLEALGPVALEAGVSVRGAGAIQVGQQEVSGGISFVAAALSALGGDRAAPDEERFSEIELLTEVDVVCAEGSIDADGFGTEALGEVSVLELGDDRRWRAHPDPSQIVRDLRVKYPLGAERCRDDAPTSFEPYGQTASLLPDRTRILDTPRNRLTDPDFVNLDGLIAIDRDRLLVSADDVLFLFERGGAFIDDDNHRIQTPEGHQLADVMARVPGSNELFVVPVNSNEPESDPETSFLEIDVSGEGIQVTATASAALRARAILFSGDGRFFAVGDEGIFVAPSHRGPFVPVQTEISTEGLKTMWRTGDPFRPFVLSTEGHRVWIGDPQIDLREEDLTFLLADDLSRLESLTVRNPGPDFELWALGTRGANPPEVVWRTAGGEWSRASMTLPPQLGSCGIPDACGLIRAQLSTDLAYDEEGVVRGSQLILRLPDCGSAARLHAPGGCTTRLHPPPNVDLEISVARIYEDHAYAVGKSGLILQLPLSTEDPTR